MSVGFHCIRLWRCTAFTQGLHAQEVCPWLKKSTAAQALEDADAEWVSSNDTSGEAEPAAASSAQASPAGAAARISVPLHDTQPFEPSALPAEEAEEQQRAALAMQAQRGPLPTLAVGNDDIFWMHQLQSSLVKQGYFCGEDETEDFVFASGTESAVLSFQVPYLLCIALASCLPALLEGA